MDTCWCALCGEAYQAPVNTTLDGCCPACYAELVCEIAQADAQQADTA
jgi:hypothetical protein